MWPKFCVALVTTYGLHSKQNLEPLSYSFLFWIHRHSTPVALLLYSDNTKDWSKFWNPLYQSGYPSWQFDCSMMRFDIDHI